MRFELPILLSLVATIATSSGHRHRHRRHRQTRRELCDKVLGDRHQYITISELERIQFGSKFTLDRHFKNYVDTNGRNYTTTTEKQLRRRSYALTALYVQCHNCAAKDGYYSFTVRIPFDADDIFYDYGQQPCNTARYCDERPQHSEMPEENSEVAMDNDRPSSIDWREGGFVSDVENQFARCQSCYAFTSAYTIEAALKLKTGGPLIRLSKQQSVDCSGGIFGNMGCRNGSADRVFNYVEKNGIMADSSYPYTGYEGDCRYNPSLVVTRISRLRWINDKVPSVPRVLDALAKNGPVALSIVSNLDSFRTYHKGIYYDPRCQQNQRRVDHSITAIGYGYEGPPENTQFIILKNTRGKRWGDKGFMKMRIQYKDGEYFNACQLATYAVIPIIR